MHHQDQTSASKETIISLLLHDLQPPLQTLKFLTGHLAAGSQEMGVDQLRAYSNDLNRAIEELALSSAAIFTWLEVQRQRFVPKPKAVSLQELLTDAQSFYKQEIPRSNTPILCSAPADAYATIDREAVGIILHQLLRNAAHQNPGGTIQLRAWEQDGNAFISVADKGKGMSSRVAENIQEHLRGNLANPVLYRYGYRIIIRVLQLLGGSIRFEQAPLGGSVITVKLPEIAA